MTQILPWLALSLVLGLTQYFGFLALIVLAAAGRRGATDRRDEDTPAATRFLFVVPAHDEAGVIAITVASCRAVDYDPARFGIAVIADNCTDETARIAAEAGATVVVRVDDARRSKGFALEDFFLAAPGDPRFRDADAYVLVDADTSADPGLLRAFDRSLRRGDDFIQGYYTVRNADASWRTRLMTYAFALANGVWPAGLDRLGLGVGLKGNGMCFRAAALRRFPWRAHGLVEDMEFAWHLRLGGERVRFQPAAVVYGEMVSRGGAGAASQRQRWERGRQELRGSFRRDLRRSRLGTVARLGYGLDLDFPPLSRLVAALGLVSLVVVAARLLAGPGPTQLAGLIGVATWWMVFFSYLVSPFLVMGLPLRYASSLLHAPYYIAWKATLGRLKKPAGWIRTPRETVTAD